jgi:hypothetical protein
VVCCSAYHPAYQSAGIVEFVAFGTASVAVCGLAAFGEAAVAHGARSPGPFAAELALLFVLVPLMLQEIE